MTGPVFRPARSRTVCSLARLHRDLGQPQPPAAYLLFVADCLAAACAGGLWCLGHTICIDCGAGVREGRLEYRHHPDVVPQVQAVTSR